MHLKRLQGTCAIQIHSTVSSISYQYKYNELVLTRAIR